MEEAIKTDGPKRLDHCTTVKTVLMLLVVAYHSLLFWGGNWFTAAPSQISKPMYLLAQWLNSFHIYAFTLVSGYIFYYLKCENDSYQKFGPFLKNKAKRLLVPYAFVSAVWAIPVQILFFTNDFRTIFVNYALGVNPSQLWFLLMLFWVYLLFGTLGNFFAKHHRLGGITVLLCYGAGMLGSMYTPNIFMIWTACMYAPFFWLGFKLRQMGGRIVFRIPWWLWLCGDLLLFVAVQLLNGYDGMIFSLLRMGLQFILNMTGALMAFVCLQKLADMRLFRGKAFRFLGSRSMGVYLFHQQIIYFVITCLDRFLWPPLTAIACFVISLIASLFITNVLMKFRATKLLIGEK